ncbi:MAG: DoxX family protein [Parachlamydiaceae bacterium]
MNNKLVATGNFLQPFFLLSVRLFWGWQFLCTGAGKLSDIGHVATFFGTLGFPFPLANAYVAAGIETVGGACLLLGLASRLMCLPLIGAMIVALLTAHTEATLGILDDPLNFVGQLPFTFLFAAIIVFIFGPGRFSLDKVIFRSCT